jgi:hypothetical protein
MNVKSLAFAAVAVLTVALSCLVTSTPAAAVDDFATTPPFLPAKNGVETFQFTGVLTGYLLGADAGGFTVKNASGTTMTFDVAMPMLINGQKVRCRIPPAYPTPPYYQQCPDWPSTIVIGTTIVTVTWWMGSSGYPTSNSFRAGGLGLVPGAKKAPK